MIRRDKYLEKITPFIDKPVIKVITGLRRCGKSTFAKLLIQELQSKKISPKNIVYINKDSLEYDFIANYNDLYQYVTKKVSKIIGKKYLIVDEVQEIESWERAITSFFNDDVADIYITGSNSRMLSSELATLLTGRYIELHLNTLAFTEHLKFRGKDRNDEEKEFTNYLKYGGLPGIHQMEFNDEVISQYISAIYSTILLKDVVAKNQIRDVALLERIVKYIADNCGNITTAKGISDFLKSQRISCSVDTIMNYIQWLIDSYIIYKVSRYDIKGKKQLELYEKYYLGDIGFIFSILGNKFDDISGKLENIVFLELISRGYRVSIGKLYEKEVDFIAFKSDRKIYFQVAYLLSDEKVIEREFGVFNSIKDNYTKIVLSLDKFFMGEKDGVKWYNLIDFLQKDDY
jgi:predicted AAA+ superfamily ATPase